MHFLPGYPPSPSRLLARFLPPLAEGVAAHYVEQFSGQGDLVFDPFGQAPGVAVEALHLGRRVLVANFNPISHLALSLAVRPPTEADLRSALTLLGDVRTTSREPRERDRGMDGDRLENYLRGLYRTTCADCGTETSADSFDWDTDAMPDAPIERTYLCPQCGPPHKHGPTTEADHALARHFTRGLDYQWLLTRVTPLDDPDRVHAEEALEVYPPRALTALAALLVKLDALNPPPETRRLLAALVVAACDVANMLTLERPKALAVPKRFREHNFWLAMEKATGTLAGVPAPDRSLSLSDLLSQTDSGIHAHSGPVRELIPSLPEGACALVISALPRPNQAYWTLSALWSAWLWGRESAAALRSVLRRRRYDWSWHADALNRTFVAVLPALASGGKMIGLMPEAEPGFVGCALAGADGAGYTLTDAVLRADTAEAQIVWERAAHALPADLGPMLDLAITNTAQQAAVETLRARGEPSRWMTIHFGAWRGLAQARYLSAIPDDAFSHVSHLLDPVFRDPKAFQRLGADTDDDLATGLWYLPGSSLSSFPSSDSSVISVDKSTPLADRVDSRVLRLLSNGEAIHEQDVIREICAAFPGVQTPGRGLVLACLSSYAQRVGAEVWQLRPEDASAERAKELEAIQAELRALAVRHGYDVAGANPQEWREDGQTIYLFAVISSAVISSHLLGPQLPARRRFLVLPGGRAGLVAFKLRRDPRLRAAMVSGNWIVVKFRHIRRMASDAQLTRATLEPAFAGDPLEEAKQLALITDERG